MAGCVWLISPHPTVRPGDRALRFMTDSRARTPDCLLILIFVLLILNFYEYFLSPQRKMVVVVQW